MKIFKLSVRAWEILLTIDERSNLEDGTYWLPACYPGCDRGTDDWCKRLGRFVNITGSGDARIIKSLRDKGLISQVASRQCSVNEYASRITEKGRLFIEDGLENGRIPLTVNGSPLKYVDGHLPG